MEERIITTHPVDKIFYTCIPLEKMMMMALNGNDFTEQQKIRVQMIIFFESSCEKDIFFSFYGNNYHFGLEGPQARRPS